MSKANWHKRFRWALIRATSFAQRVQLHHGHFQHRQLATHLAYDYTFTLGHDKLCQYRSCGVQKDVCFRNGIIMHAPATSWSPKQHVFCRKWKNSYWSYLHPVHHTTARHVRKYSRIWVTGGKCIANCQWAMLQTESCRAEMNGTWCDNTCLFIPLWLSLQHRGLIFIDQPLGLRPAFEKWRALVCLT